MEKLPESPARNRRRQFKDWRRILNPFLITVLDQHGVTRLRVRWVKLIASIGIGTAGLWLTGAGGACFFVRSWQHVTAVNYFDFVLPSRWVHVRTARGDQHVATAKMLAATGKKLEALFLVRDGIVRSPANRDGRLLLTQLLLEAGRPDLTRQVFFDGLAYHHRDPEYLRPLFSFLFQRQADANVIALARKYLPPAPATTECDRLYSLAAATAGYFRGHYDLAEDFLRRQPALATSRDGRLLTAKMDWGRGYRDLALLHLRELAAAYPDDVDIHAELAAHLDRANLHDEARRTALTFQIAHPALPIPRLELIRAYTRTGDHTRAASEIDAYLRDFVADAPALLALADFSANTGNVSLARRLTEIARAQHSAWEPHAILAVEALVVARDNRGALAAVRDLLHDHPDWTARFGPVFTSLQAIAHFGLGDADSASLLLTAYLNQSHLRAENLLAIAQRLVDVDAAEAARQTLIRATVADPLNQAALTRLVELDLNLNRIDELPGHLTRLLAMRQPSPDILRVAQHKLGSDLFLFSAEQPATLAAVRVALEQSSRRLSRL